MVEHPKRPNRKMKYVDYLTGKTLHVGHFYADVDYGCGVRLSPQEIARFERLEEGERWHPILKTP